MAESISAGCSTVHDGVTGLRLRRRQPLGWAGHTLGSTASSASLDPTIFARFGLPRRSVNVSKRGRCDGPCMASPVHVYVDRPPQSRIVRHTNATGDPHACSSRRRCQFRTFHERRST
jgi:hypothetical protein